MSRMTAGVQICNNQRLLQKMKDIADQLIYEGYTVIWIGTNDQRLDNSSNEYIYNVYHCAGEYNGGWWGVMCNDYLVSLKDIEQTYKAGT